MGLTVRYRWDAEFDFEDEVRVEVGQAVLPRLVLRLGLVRPRGGDLPVDALPELRGPSAELVAGQFLEARGSDEAGAIPQRQTTEKCGTKVACLLALRRRQFHPRREAFGCPCHAIYDNGEIEGWYG